VLASITTASALLILAFLRHPDGATEHIATAPASKTTN